MVRASLTARSPGTIAGLASPSESAILQCNKRLATAEHASLSNGASPREERRSSEPGIDRMGWTIGLGEPQRVSLILPLEG